MDARDVTFGVVLAGTRVAVASGRLMLAPVRVAARLPGIRGPVYGTAVVLEEFGFPTDPRPRAYGRGSAPEEVPLTLRR